MTGLGAVHMGRSWIGHPIEDDCPCGKAPCGLVDGRLVSKDCPQHTLDAAKTMRQIHFAHDCPAERSPEGASTASEVRS